MPDKMPRRGILGRTRRFGYIVLFGVSFLLNGYFSFLDVQYRYGMMMSLFILVIASIPRVTLEMIDRSLVLFSNVGALIMIYGIFTEPGFSIGAREAFIYVIFLVVWFGILSLRWAIFHACLLVTASLFHHWEDHSQQVLTIGFFVLVSILLTQMTVAGRRIQEERVITERFADLAMKDQLTDLYNRRFTLSRMQSYYRDLKRGENSDKRKKMGVLLIDIDHFKKVNDQKGHQIGDQILQQVANILKQCAGEKDLVGRWGGEEFLLVVEESDHQILQQICKKIQKTLQDIPQDLPRVTVSIGMAQSDEGEDVDTLLRYADRRLYRAKNNGRNQANMDQLDNGEFF